MFPYARFVTIILSYYLIFKAITSDPQESPDKKPAQKDSIEARDNLRKGIKPKEKPQGELLDPADSVLTLIDALGSKEPGKSAERKDAVLSAVAGLMFYYLKPEVKEEEEKELASWERQIGVAKEQVEKIDRDIFSKLQ